MTKKEPFFTKDIPNKQLTVVRDFDAPLPLVWLAWTDRNILDQWWAPKPWKAETKFMDFKPGGRWLYCMVSPDSTQRHWCCVDYQAIEPQVSVRSTGAFCDEEGHPDSNMPKMFWHQQFRAACHGTTVTVVITFPGDAEFETILKMGFQEGFTMGLANLDELFSQHPEKIAQQSPDAIPQQSPDAIPQQSLDAIAQQSPDASPTQPSNSRLGLPSLP